MSDKHTVELDRIDKAILELLQSDTSLTKTKLAEKVGLTAPAVLERIRKLEERGVIDRYVAILNPKRVGQTFTSFVSIVLAVHQLQAVQKFTEAVSKLPEVLECHHVTGDSDFVLRVIAKDADSYQHILLNRLAHLPGVQKMQTFVVLSTIKADTRIPLD